jgi:hypothetical protein
MRQVLVALAHSDHPLENGRRRAKRRGGYNSLAVMFTRFLPRLFH